jgi:hypothetical protein
MPGVILGRSTVNTPRGSSVKIVGEFCGESFYLKYAVLCLTEASLGIACESTSCQNPFLATQETLQVHEAIRALRCHHYLIPTLDSESKKLYANIDLTAFTGLTLIHLSDQKLEINLL